MIKLIILTGIMLLPSVGQPDHLNINGHYLIIVSDDYLNSPSLLTFKLFREQEFAVQVIAGSSIGITKDDYRNFIRNLMPDYVLLVGKYGDFPVHYIHSTAEVESFNYYVASSTTGHPNPDIPLGLFFADNESELANLVNKTISYENSSPLYPNIYYAHAGSSEALPPWPIEFNEEILTEMYVRYFQPDGYDFTLATANDSTPNDPWTDINMINSGIHYMIYHGHGNINRWSFGLGTGGLFQLNNTIYPIIFSFACLTGTFSGVASGDTNVCFAQKITASEHGAAAFLGAYNISGKGMNQVLEGAINGLYNDSVPPRLGNVLLHAYANTVNTNTVDFYYPIVTDSERTRSAWQFHLFGDPALRIRNTTTSIHEDEVNIPSEIMLYQNYPNPFNPTTTITFSIPQREHVTLAVFDVLGREVATLVDGELNPGGHSVVFDAASLPSGVYFYSMTTSAISLLKSMTAIK